MEIINIAAIIISPIIAVSITLWYQNNKAKQDAKYRLFLILMAHRKRLVPTYDLVDSLNTIDVIFSNHENVIKLWHEYYALLCQKFDETNYEARSHKHLQLLSVMAKVLGYKNIQQIDIDSFYVPEAHGSIVELSYKIQTELLRVLENTSHFLGVQKDLKGKSTETDNQNLIAK
ncbi:MAG: hypothetical protein M0Q21_07125 [Ignavibacteriaceae bacterium]|nr:hypothetical protein [Ignavibacteriaceae bacterium]